ncbi:MAG: hypothetical protein ACR2KK_16860 [Acidimicrobiales bacterium]
MTISADAPHRPSLTRPRLSPKEDLLTVAFSAWLIAGLFVDGWAHNNGKPESFFTPWHGLFYSGFLATAAWMFSRYQRHGGVPVGYGLGFIGVIAFAAGGVADMVWHQIFGVEVDLEALLSPSHLLLFFSGLLVVSSPLRAALFDPDSTSPSMQAFLPALLSTTIVTATVSFFLMQFSPFLSNSAIGDPYRYIAENVDPEIGGWLAEELQLEGFAAILVTTVVLMGPTLLLLRRWRLPAGSLTLLFTAVAVLDSSLLGFELGETVLAAVVAGFAADMLARQLQPTRSTATVLRTVGFVVPLVLWLTYFGVLATFYSVGWSVEFWSGITVMAALAGLGLAVLMSPAGAFPVVHSPIPDELATQNAPGVGHG